jgi:hypothetical protein
MSACSPNERDLFAALTMTLMAMKDAPYAEVQAAIEDCFRCFLRREGVLGPGSLQITWTCSLPEGPEAFAIYRTEYQTEASARPRIATGGPAPVADVIPFRRRAAAKDPRP